MERIGILGGTFDPPHIGHLIIAEEARIALQLKEVWFIPSYEPPHKEKAQTSTKNRLDMLQMSTDDNEFFKINKIEIDRAGKSYTIDTITELKKHYPNYEFHFIIGADMVEYLPHWKSIDQLLSLLNFVGVNRPGYQLQTTYPITFIDVPMVHVSSTFIRDRLNNGKTAQYLVTPSVHHYIKEKCLYGYRPSNRND